MSTTYGPGLTPLRWCCHYLCPSCDDPGLKPGRSTVLAPPGSVAAAFGGGM